MEAVQKAGVRELEAVRELSEALEEGALMRDPADPASAQTVGLKCAIGEKSPAMRRIAPTAEPL